ncbi:MAG: carbohydrate binding domain-containing protein [Capsulimonadaceae bacterium]|nr:carbohydrate binding domain-containing protein [Capsulimonadaceae bacterium]
MPMAAFRVAHADDQASSTNAVINGDFEQGLNGWKWVIASRADACAAVDSTQPHSGRNAVRITNKSQLGANVYGSLQQGLTGLKPGTEYELSLWVKSVNANNCWFGGGPDWKVRQGLPVNAHAWSREAIRFKTGKDDTTWIVIINADGPTDELLLDDVAIVEANGRHAWVFSPAVNAASLAGEKASVELAKGAYDAAFYDKSEDISGTASFTAPANYPGGRVSLGFRNNDGSETTIASAVVPAVSASSILTVPFLISATWFPQGKTLMQVCLDRLPVASATVSRDDISGQLPQFALDTAHRLDKVRGDAAARRLTSNSYVGLGLNVASRFVNRVEAPDIAAKQNDGWTWLQLREVQSVLDETEQLLRNPIPSAPSCPFGPVRIDRGVFVSDKLGASGPVFFGGYGHFDQVLKDAPNFPGLGASIIQNEMGPNSLRSDGTDTGNLSELLSRFKRCTANSISLDLLLSPHYFPKWAQLEAPDVMVNNPGFITYNIDHPVARKAVGQWIKAAVSAVKDEPSLFSVCLSNEPVYEESGRDPYSRPLWIEYLRSKHGAIDNLNMLYGTSYKSFDDVLVPPAAVPSLTEPTNSLCAYYDWMQFNAEHFADWHRWMNGIVKSVAPNVRTHSKVMVFDVLSRDALDRGTDLEQFCNITGIAGNDEGTGVLKDDDTDAQSSIPYAYKWQGEELAYDLLRSFRNQPVFNSENHIIPDHYTLPVPGDYVRSVMWQGALHGQGATTTWVWGEEPKPSGDLYGSIYFRPADIFGAGRAWIDALRCAAQVAAIVRAKPHIAILYTRTSLYWQKDYAQSVLAAYTALTFLGEPVTFVSETQLAEGRVPPVRAILLPHATNVGDGAVNGLATFVANGGRLIALGDGNLSRDEYSRARDLSAALKPTPLPFSDDERVVYRQLSPIAKVLGAPGELHDAASGKGVLGVEFRVVSDRGRTYLSALNQTKTPVTVRLSRPTSGVGKDLLSGQTIALGAIKLNSMQPRLIELP